MTIVTKEFSWVHLSDIHFGKGREWNQGEATGLRDSMLRTLKELPQVNALFITGDIAHSGRGVQYEWAHELIETFTVALQIGKNMVFVVPGNHDVNREQAGEGFGGNRGPGFGGSGLGQTRPGSMGGFNANRPAFGGAGAGRFPGGGAGGFGGNRSGLGAVGQRGLGAVGQRGPGAVGIGERPSRGQLNSFLGLPSDGGLHAAVGGSRLGRDQRGLARYPDADLRRRGDDVRRDLRGRNFYSRDWYRRYPGVWYPRAWAYGDVWAAATLTSMNDWLGYGDTQPTYYDYGNNVTYQDNSVYVDGQPVGTSDEYYQQAQDLASTGENAADGDDQQWMPLGVFAMTTDQQSDANTVLQLAVNKQGVIRGNYTNTTSNETKPVQGSVDKKSQRAAWTIGDKKENVMETGIYNLTKDEASALVHIGKDKTEQVLLVRLKQDDQEQPNP